MHWHLPILLGMLLTHAVIASNSSSRGAFLLPTTRARILATRTRTTVSAEYLSVSSSSSSTTTLSSADVLNKVKTECTTPCAPKLVFLPECKWRSAAAQHSKRMEALLRPGLLSHPSQPTSTPKRSTWTALDPSNPIYNFLIEYYGLKGTKGVRRLARWSPDPELLLSTSVASSDDVDGSLTVDNNDEIYQSAMEASHGLGGILLMNATIDDLGSILHLRGGVPVPYVNNPHVKSTAGGGEWRKSNKLYGVLYNPSVFYNDLRIASASTTDATSNTATTDNKDNDKHQDDNRLQRTIAPYQWYTSVLETTLNSEPVLHCHGLHEWAMLYHPIESDPPPSAMYQPNLPLRVSTAIINEAVERAGIRCTHVDALRFFAPDALPLNRHTDLTRMDQLRLEQKGCVHAHMDLLKMALKLSPFVDSKLLGDVLEVALDARKLDVSASPYDASEYGLRAVPVETREGRKLYRRQQSELMNKAEPVRRRLLRAYEVFMELAFSDSIQVGRGGLEFRETA